MYQVGDTAAEARLRQACDAVNAELARKKGHVVIALGFGLVASALSLGYDGPLRFFLLAASGILVLGIAVHAYQTLGRQFKAHLATTIVPALRPGLSFHPLGDVSVAEFNGLQLFANRAERVKATDELRGDQDGVSFSVQETHATYTTTTHNGKSTQRHTHTIFRGVVVKLEFNKHFHGHTVIVPEFLGSSLFAAFLGSGDLVSLENAEFEERFVVRSTDQQEARYLITPRFMEIVLEAHALLGDQPRLAFRDGTFHLLIPTSVNRFEVSPWRGVSPERTLGELNAVIRLAERLIGAFDLGTRIWTRA